jgi:hypothetical protein
MKEVNAIVFGVETGAKIISIAAGGERNGNLMIT